MENNNTISISHTNGVYEEIENSLSELRQHIEEQTTIYALLNSRLTRLPSDIVADTPLVSFAPTFNLYVQSAATHIMEDCL